MRLIDADRLFHNLERGVRNTSNQVFREIANTPTVKAIPIEWLERQLDVFGDGFYDLRLVIKHWEKENEIDRCR